MLERATGHRPPDSATARRALAALGLPVPALGYGELLTKGHPAHTGD